MTPVDVTPSQLETIALILSEHLPELHRALAFGSRAKWTAKAHSDLDLAIDAGRKLNFAEHAALEYAFEASPLPWKVDVVDLNGVSESFRAVILRDGVALPITRPQSGWRNRKLGDLIELKRGYDLPQGQRRPGSYPIISSSGLSGHHDRYMAKAPGVVTGRYGTIGEVFYIEKDFWPLNTALYVRDFKGAHPRYVYYLLKTLNWSLFNDKSGVPGVNRNHIHEAVVRAPPLAEQKRIAACLSAFDDKIELNRRMNETLEAMAKAIFHDWFVDFGPVRRKLAGETDPVAIMGGLTPDPVRATELAALFPGMLDEDDLPRGWVERPLDQIAEFLNGLALQKFPAIHGEPSLPVIKIAELRNGLTDRSNRASPQLPDKYIVRDGDYLFSWSGSLMAKVWTEGDGALNQHLFKVSSASYPRWFYAAWVEHHLPEFQRIAASKATTMGHIQRGHLTSAMTVCPPQPTLNGMAIVLAPLWERRIHNDLENRALAETRDYLLPRLMSGQVRVGDVALEITQ